MTALNYANKIFYNGAEASAVYVGSTKVWPGFKPTDIAGCAVWLDASKLNLANGANVTTWTNLGSGTQPVITGTPKYRTNALNTVMPCVRFNQGAGKLRMTGTGVDKDWTIIYVGRRWSLNNPGRTVAAHDPTNILIGTHGYEGDQAYIEGWLTTGQSPPATTLWKMYGADSTSTAVARFFINGFLQVSGAATPARGWAGTLCISGYIDDQPLATTQECDCEIAELVMFNRKLTDTERGQIERYLRAKWMAPIWTPRDISSSLGGWFDCSDVGTVQVVGSGVNQWFSKAGGMVVTQSADDTYRPAYLSAGGVNFTLAKGMNSSGGPSAFDILVVAKPNPYGADPINWRTMLRSVGAHEIIIEDKTNRLGTYYTGFYPAGGLTWPAVDGMCFARVAPNTAVQISRDGGALTATGIALTSTSAMTTMFGCYMGPPPTQGFGLVKEVIYFPWGSADSTRQLLEGYLAHKWGLDPLLPAGHPYKNAPPLNKA